MQDSIGTGGHSLDSYLPISWMEQSEQFRGAVLDIFMRIGLRLSLMLPMSTRIGASLIGTGFILRPDC